MNSFNGETSKNIAKNQSVYSDMDGIFDCTLIKYNDDNSAILDEIQIKIVNDSLKYSLLILKSSDETSIDISDSNIESVKSRFHSINETLYSAKVIRRGLSNQHIDEFSEIKQTDTDLALLQLEDQLPNLSKDTYFDPKVNVITGDIPINSRLYLAGYNGESKKEYELSPYKYLKNFQGLTMDKLNKHHNGNYKSISIGNFIKKSSEDNPYSFHTCSTLSGSSGSLILDLYGKLAGSNIQF
ncbi:hypothetical protein I4U23_026609 [Adineta vaga]|nr:hypothetical protein I4U23_026609 [Adineta vaga]